MGIYKAVSVLGEKCLFSFLLMFLTLHDKHFVVAVRFNSDRVARGEGRSKKAAEQCAAREALKLLGVLKER